MPRGDSSLTYIFYCSSCSSLKESKHFFMKSIISSINTNNCFEDLSFGQFVLTLTLHRYSIYYLTQLLPPFWLKQTLPQSFEWCYPLTNLLFYKDKCNQECWSNNSYEVSFELKFLLQIDRYKELQFLFTKVWVSNV